MAASVLAVADSGIQDCVSDVREQASQHRHDPYEENDRQLHRVVVGHGGVVEGEPETREVEDVLNDEAGGDDSRQDEADHRGDREERVPKNVPGQDPPLARALGLGRSDVVLA